MRSKNGCLPLLTAQAAIGNNCEALVVFPVEPLSVQADRIWPKCHEFNDLRYLKKERQWTVCVSFGVGFRGEFNTLIVKIDAVLWVN